MVAWLPIQRKILNKSKVIRTAHEPWIVDGRAARFKKAPFTNPSTEARSHPLSLSPLLPAPAPQSRRLLRDKATDLFYQSGKWVAGHLAAQDFATWAEPRLIARSNPTLDLEVAIYFGDFPKVTVPISALASQKPTLPGATSS
mgnify:CR=1 FL=1